MRVLTIAAHPDDVEILCAGTLGIMKRQGHDLWLAHMTVGDKGGQQPPEELARTRGAEAVAAAGILGAEVYGGICGDLELYASEEHAQRIAQILHEVAPDLVITHALNDYHPDHHVTGRLTLEQISALDGRQPALLYMDTVAGIESVPDFYSDITETVELKKQMIRCHVSQIQWMATYRHTDMEYIIEWCGRWRGLQCGAPYAEGYRVEASVGDPERTRELGESIAFAPAWVA